MYTLKRNIYLSNTKKHAKKLYGSPRCKSLISDPLHCADLRYCFICKSVWFVSVTGWITYGAQPSGRSEGSRGDRHVDQDCEKLRMSALVEQDKLEGTDSSREGRHQRWGGGRENMVLQVEWRFESRQMKRKGKCIMGRRKRGIKCVCVCVCLTNCWLVDHEDRDLVMKSSSAHTQLLCSRGWPLEYLSCGVLRSDLSFCSIPPVTMWEMAQKGR